MFSANTSNVEALHKIRKFDPISQRGNVQKTHKNDVSTENLLTGRISKDIIWGSLYKIFGISKSFVFYAVRSAKAS